MATSVKIVPLPKEVADAKRRRFEAIRRLAMQKLEVARQHYSASVNDKVTTFV